MITGTFSSVFKYISIHWAGRFVNNKANKNNQHLHIEEGNVQIQDSVLTLLE